MNPVLRFPFRGPDANERISAVLTQAEPLLYQLAHERFPKAPRDTIEEVVQRTRITLWSRSLPAYDADAGASVNTFLRLCARRIIIDESRRLGASDHPAQLLDADRPVTQPDAPELPDDLLDSVSPHLSRGQRRLLQLLTETPDREQLAHRLGVPTPRAYERVSRLKRHIRQVLARSA